MSPTKEIKNIELMIINLTSMFEISKYKKLIIEFLETIRTPNLNSIKIGFNQEIEIEDRFLILIKEKIQENVKDTIDSVSLCFDGFIILNFLQS